MPSVDVLIESKLARSVRVKQLEGMFDVPAAEKCRLEWKGELPIEAKEWNIGLIVGPSGSGKSTILREVFGEPKTFRWKASSVVDDFAERFSIEEIAAVCGAVGFNTIPAWIRPFSVLSNGERFRVELARRLLECKDLIVIDEFTSVVDRQVAKIASHATQKHIRKAGRKLVAASCHGDIVDWLQPDWILEPATMRFHWRGLQRRPKIKIEIGRVEYEAWKLFAPFHYLTAGLHKAAKCYGLYADGTLASFGAVLHRPHPSVRDIKGLSRLVTLPDFQGLGLAMILCDRLGSAYRAVGLRFHTYPAHPHLIRVFGRSQCWRLRKKAGVFSMKDFRSASGANAGQRPCAIFEYKGPSMNQDEAERLTDSILLERFA